MLQHNPALRAKIDQLWNKFWTGGITNPLSVIEQITYLLFMKRIDALDARRQADAQWSGQSYRSHFSGHWIPPEERHLPPAQQRPISKQSLRWSEFKPILSRLPLPQRPQRRRRLALCPAHAQRRLHHPQALPPRRSG